MRRLLLSLSAALLVAPAAHAAEFVTPKQAVGLYVSDGAFEQDPVNPIPPNTYLAITPEAGSTTRSPSYLVRQVGPIDIEAGDCLDVRAREVFHNPNDANGWWTVNGVRSEHWWLWVGGDAGINYTTGAPPASADVGNSFRRNTGENWDAVMRRWPWDVSEIRCFADAIDDLYLFTHVEWYSSAGYRLPATQYIQVEEPTGKLEVVHYGTP